MTDPWTPYETGLEGLLARLGREHPRYAEALTLQSRLLENVASARHYGDDETRRAGRAQIIDALNRLALETVGESFNALCGLPPAGGSPLVSPSPQPGGGATYHVHVEHASGLAIGDGAQVTQVPSPVTIIGDGNVVGDGSSSHVAKGAAPPGAGPPGGQDTAALRRLLTAAFDDGELTTLCFDHFYPLYEQFSAGMSKEAKVRRLLDYCLRQEQVERLLTLLQARNPAQFARFAHGEFGQDQ
jgi:hypothetical protein